MSAANFSVRWVHRNPVLVTGFISNSVEWLGSIFQIVNDGRLLSNPLRSIEAKEIGLQNSFDWLDTQAESLLMEDFWNDILSPAAVAEETTLYSTRSGVLANFAVWPGPLTISDFRALMFAPWMTENFNVKSVVIVPNAHLFVQEMMHRKRENRSVIRLEYIEPLLKAQPDLSPIPFEQLLQLEHTSEQFAAVFAILNHWFKKETDANSNILLFPYQALFESPYQAISELLERLGSRRKREVGDALKAVRISYDGANYQKIPHSPKDPAGWNTSLHPGQVAAIDAMLVRMNCPAGGLVDWKAAGVEPDLSSRPSSRSGGSRSGRSSSRSRSSSKDAFSDGSFGKAKAVDMERESGSHRSSSRNSSSGRSSSGRSSRSRRSDSGRDQADDD